MRSIRSLRFLVALAALAFAPAALAAPAEAQTAPAPAPAPAPAKPERVGTSGSHIGRIPGLGVSITVRSFELQNGLRVYVLEDHSVPALSLQLVYEVGSRDEVAGRTGFAHFFEHMMYKGSANVPDGGHFKHVLGVGGKMNAFTSNDYTLYYNVLPSQYLELGLWLESDRLRSLAITEENFENQRKAVQEEKAMRVDNVPYAKAIAEFFAQAWAGTPYGHPGMGTDEDLAAAELADVKAFFDKYYVPNNAVMVLVGDVEFDDVKTKVEKYFGDIPRGAAREPFAAIDHTQAKLEKRYVDKHAQQPLYMIGWKTVPEDHPDRHAVDVLMSILLNGESSRISKVLKDEKKLVVASVPLSGSSGGRDAGAAFAAFVPVKGASLDSIKAVVKSEIAAVKTKGVRTKDLNKAINQVTVRTVDDLATNNGRGMQIGVGALFHDDPTWVLTDLQGYRAVKPADIKRVANKYLTDEWMVVEIVPAGQ